MKFRPICWTAVLSVAFAAHGSAQASFEVSSVKPSSSVGPTSLAPLSGGRISARNVEVRTLIRAAYQVQDFQISGAPGWLESERYDIDAKSAAAADATQTRLMVQTLLADRFHLKLRREMRDVPALALVVSNGGKSKLTPADGSGCQAQPSSPNPCGRIRSSPNFVITGDRVTMQQFAMAIGGMLGQTVIDKTGLTGVFNLDLDLGAAGFAPTPGSPGNEMEGVNAFMAGLQEQLGLKLERTTSAIEMLVIEHVERPSAN